MPSRVIVDRGYIHWINNISIAEIQSLSTLVHRFCGNKSIFEWKEIKQLSKTTSTTTETTKNRYDTVINKKKTQERQRKKRKKRSLEEDYSKTSTIIFKSCGDRMWSILRPRFDTITRHSTLDSRHSTPDTRHLTHLLRITILAFHGDIVSVNISLTYGTWKKQLIMIYQGHCQFIHHHGLLPTGCSCTSCCREAPRVRGTPSRSRPYSSDSYTPCGYSRRPSLWSRYIWDTP